MSLLRRLPTGLLASLLLLATLIALGTGCSVSSARGDYPLGNGAISIGTATLGEDSTVSIHRQRSESSDCETRGGEFGPYVDCETMRVLVSKVVSFTCLPAEACKDIRIDGANVVYVPRMEKFDVHVVGDIEGDRVEKTQAIIGKRPQVTLTLHATSPSGSSHPVAVAGARVSACRTGSKSAHLKATLDGEPVVVLTDKATSFSICDVIVAPRAGKLHVTVALDEPAIDLATADTVVRPLEDVRDVEITDLLCSKGTDIHAFNYMGKWSLSIALTGVLADGAIVAVPGSAARYVDGDLTMPPSSDPTEWHMGFLLTAAPSATARIDVTIGDRVFSVPVVATEKCN